MRHTSDAIMKRSGLRPCETNWPKAYCRLVHGRMDVGPRALGRGASILGDARNPTMQAAMNLKINSVRAFARFAPCVLQERVSNYF